MFGSCGEHQQEFGILGHAVVLVAKQKRSKCFAKGSATRLTGFNDRHARSTQPCRHKCQVAGLADAFDTFQGDEFPLLGHLRLSWYFRTALLCSSRVSEK